MGGSLSEGLRIIFAIVITCLVIGFVFTIWSTTKETGNTALTQANKLNTQMAESEYTQYDGVMITGSEVYNLIKQHESEDICIQVKTPSGTQNYICDGAGLTPVDKTTEKENLVHAKDKTQSNYINPSAKFMGTVIRADGTDAILGLVFDQEGNIAESF